jgi:hypothetical protein
MRCCLLIISSALLFCGIARAQAVQFGVVGGIPLTPLTPRGNQQESPPYLIGPSIEFRLPASFAIEVDGIYRRIGSSYSGQFFTDVGTTTPSQFFNRNRGNAWEVPVMGKYYFTPSRLSFRPFLASGFSFRTVTQQNTSTFTSGTLTQFSGSLRSALDVGAVGAAGLQFKAGCMKIEPQIRYTRWGSGSQGELRKNQADFVLGLRF